MLDIGVSLNCGNPGFEAAFVRRDRDSKTVVRLTVGFRIWENQNLFENPTPSF